MELGVDSRPYGTYSRRLSTFNSHFERHLRSSWEGPHCQLLGQEVLEFILERFRDAFTRKFAFFAWAARDVREMYTVVWDHLAIDCVDDERVGRQEQEKEREPRKMTPEEEQGLVITLLTEKEEQTVRAWVSQRLESLEGYQAELFGI